MNRPVIETPRSQSAPSAQEGSPTGGPMLNPRTLPRISSRHLLRDRRVVEIDHDGRIYQLRVTQLNKLILTA